MLHRIQHEDLIAIDVAYHVGCLSTYIGKTNIKKSVASADAKNEHYKTAFEMLIVEINDDLLIKRKARLLSNLLHRFKELLPREMNAGHYTSSKLQNTLTKHFGDRDASPFRPNRGRGYQIS